MKTRQTKKLLPLHLLLVILTCALLPLARAQNIPARISLVVTDGEGATNGVRQHVAREPVVKVEDDDHRPVAGAAVVFALPVSGASGEFPNGASNLTVVTGRDGSAAAHGLKTNGVPGKLQIYVTATYRGLRARTLINQFVEGAPGTKARVADLRPSHKSGGKWKWVVLTMAAAGGAGAAYYYHLNHTSASPVSISAGTVVFGSPR